MKYLLKENRSTRQLPRMAGKLATAVRARTRTLVLLPLLAVCLSGCEGVVDKFKELAHHVHKAYFPDPPPPPIPVDPDHPRVELTQDTIRINGKPIPLDATFTQWEQAIGRRPRCEEPQGEYDTRSCTFHDVGIWLMSGRKDKSRVELLELSLWLPPTEHYLDKKRPDWVPAKPYRGDIRIDGFRFDAQTDFWQIRGPASPAWELVCHGFRGCSKPSGRFGKSGSIHFALMCDLDTCPVERLQMHATGNEG